MATIFEFKKCVTNTKSLERPELMDAVPSGKRPRGQPRTRWRNYVEDLAWSRLGIPPAKLPLVAEDRDAWRCQLELLPAQPQKDKQAKGNTRNQFNVFPENLFIFFLF